MDVKCGILNNVRLSSVTKIYYCK